MSHRKLAVIFTAHLLVVVNSQFTLGTLGGGILSPQVLHTGGLRFPNADGSGPQATNLAAAIYGVAIPPGFDGFISSGNHFGANPYVKSGPQPSDLLIGTGLHTTGRGNPFLGGGDLSGSASSQGIDTVAALFGQVLPSGNEHPGFHPALIGTGESAFGGSGISTDLGEHSSPVAVAHKFNLPTFVELPSDLQFQPHSHADFLLIPKDIGVVESAPADVDTKPFRVETVPNVANPPTDLSDKLIDFQKIASDSFNAEAGLKLPEFSGPVHDDREVIGHEGPSAKPQHVTFRPREKPHSTKSTNPYLVNRQRHSSRSKFSGQASNHFPRAERLAADEPVYVVKDFDDSPFGGRPFHSSFKITRQRSSLLPAGYKTAK